MTPEQVTEAQALLQQLRDLDRCLESRDDVEYGPWRVSREVSGTKERWAGHQGADVEGEWVRAALQSMRNRIAADLARMGVTPP